MAGRLTGKRAFVTGAGRGIGRSVAPAIAREGAEVVAASRTLSTMQDLPVHSTAIRSGVRGNALCPGTIMVVDGGQTL